MSSMLRTGFALLLIALLAGGGMAQDSPFRRRGTPKKKRSKNKASKNNRPSKESKKKPDGFEDAYKKALDYLSKAQGEDGCWKFRVSQGPTPISAFCALALLASGSDLKRGPYRQNLQKALEYITKMVIGPHQAKSKKWDQRCWTLSLGGMFVAELYAKNPSRAIMKTLQKTVERMQDCQLESGGFGHGPYVPNAGGYSEMEIMSALALGFLGMAKRLGCKLDEEKLQRAIQYVEKCSRDSGHVKYSHNRSNRFPQPGRVSMNIFAFRMLGLREHPLFEKMQGYVKKNLDQMKIGHGSIAMSFFGGAAGALQFTDAEEMWDRYVTEFHPLFLEHQKENGSFKSIHQPHRSERPPGGDDVSNGKDYDPGVYTLLLGIDKGHLTFLSGALSMSKLPPLPDQADE